MVNFNLGNFFNSKIIGASLIAPGRVPTNMIIFFIYFRSK